MEFGHDSGPGVIPGDAAEANQVGGFAPGEHHEGDDRSEIPEMTAGDFEGAILNRPGESLIREVRAARQSGGPRMVPVDVVQTELVGDPDLNSGGVA